MAITFTYAEATNTVVLTEGTVGTPATFVDFVTADRAGTATLLAATAGLSPTLALTYQIRPVDVIALLITFTVAAKSVHTDYIFITGTDWRDAAQTESIDVSAGNGVYVSTKYFRTITNIDCSDGAAGGGTQWADGTVAVTQPQWGVIWDYGNSCQYQIDAIFNIGNDSDSTYFRTKSEMIYFNAGTYLQNTNAANFTSGAIVGDYGIDGSCISFGYDGELNLQKVGSTTGNMFLYATTIYQREDNFLIHSDGSIVINSCMFHLGYARTASRDTRLALATYNGGGATIDILNLYVNGGHVLIGSALATSINVWVHYSYRGLMGQIGDPTITNVRITGIDEEEFRGYMTDTVLIDLKEPLGTIGLYDAGDTLTEKYTCNIHVVDKDGVDLQNVIVDCEDTNTDAVWGAGTIVTDASGDIAEQTITYKTWTGTSETLVTSSPHKFTLSLAGYETMVLDNITVDTPIVWHLELLAQKQSPAPWQEGVM